MTPAAGTAPAAGADHAASAAAAAACLLLLCTLYQAPIAQLQVGSTVLLVRSWDLAWLLVLAAGAWLVRAGGGRPRLARPDLRSPGVLLVAYVLAAALSLVWAYVTFGTPTAAQGAIRVGRLALAAILVGVLVRCGDRGLRAVACMALAVATAAGLMALVVWVTSSAPGLLPGEMIGISRAGGPFGNFWADGAAQEWWAPPAAPNALGFWLAVALASLAGFARRHPPARRHPVRIAGLALLAASLAGGLVATHSRESWLAALIAVPLTLRASGPALPRGPARLAAAVVGALAVAAVALPSVWARIAESFRPGTFAYETGPDARLEAWSRGLEWALDRFPIGWGMGAIEENPQLFGAGTAENMFIQAFAQTGLLGLLALAGLVAAGVIRSLRLAARRPSAVLAPLAVAVFVVMAVHGTFGNTVGDPTIQVLLAVALAVLAVERRAPARAA